MKVYDGRVRLDASNVHAQLKARGEAYFTVACAIRPRTSKTGNPYLERITVTTDGAGGLHRHVRASKTGKLYLGEVPTGTSLDSTESPYFNGEVVELVPKDSKRVPFAPPPKYGPEVLGQAEWNKQMAAHKAWLESEKDNKQTGEGNPISEACQQVHDELVKEHQKSLDEMIGELMPKSGAEKSWDVFAKPRNDQRGQVIVATKVSAKSAQEACNIVRNTLQPSQWVLSEMTATLHGQTPKSGIEGAVQAAVAAAGKGGGDDNIILLREEDESLVGPEADQRIVQTVEPVLTEMFKMIKGEIDAQVSLAAGLEAKIEALRSQKQSVNMDAVRTLIENEFSKLRPSRIEIVERNEVVRTLDEHTHPLFEETLHLMQQRHPVYLFGPSGSGKTHLVEQCARALGLRFYALSTTMGTSESQLQGWRLPLGANKFVYVPAEFVNFFEEEEGGVFLLDEADRSDPNVLSVLNQALANKRLPIPQRFEKPSATMSDNFVIAAAGNTCGTGADRLYSSASRLDEAFLDRFRMGTLRMDYDRELEKALVGDTPILRRFWQIRDKVEQLRLERVVSTRSIIEAHRLKLDEKEAVLRLTVTWEPNERQKVGVAA